MKDLMVQAVTQANTANAAGKRASDKGAPGFGDLLAKTIENVNNSTREANVLATGLATGQHANIHETMIAMEKAGIQLRLITKIQNKVVEAYREIIRMQV